MPWQETNAMEERMRFVMECLEPAANVAGICRDYGIAVSTGHKWLRRYREGGLQALYERSRQPTGHPLAVTPEMVCEVVNFRGGKYTPGARKIRALLLRKHPAAEVPCIRTINRILDRTGLVEKRRRARSKGQMPSSLSSPQRCNDLWTADGKGYWRTLDGKRCEPLTIRDAVARFILDIQAMNTLRCEPTKDAFRGCFERYGLPLMIRTDNGPPFASMLGLHGLTKLSAWFIKLGIAVERIPPGKPQYNGGHERMHLDMALQLEASPARNLQAQRRACDEFRQYFNYERPHEALGDLTPAEVYEQSPREYDPQEPHFEYGCKLDVRKVNRNGYVWWCNRSHYLTKALAGEYMAFEKNDDGELVLWFCDFCLGKTNAAFSQPIVPVEV
jgi:putative transposase